MFGDTQTPRFVSLRQSRLMTNDQLTPGADRRNASVRLQSHWGVWGETEEAAASAPLLGGVSYLTPQHLHAQPHPEPKTMSRSVRDTLQPDRGYQGHAVVDGIPLSTMIRASEGEAHLALHECLAGTQVWHEHAAAVARMSEPLERALNLHLPYPPGDEDIDPVFLTEAALRGHLSSIDISSGEPAEPGAATAIHHLLTGDEAIERLVRGRYKALHASARLLQAVSPEMDLLGTDPRAGALHRHPSWSALDRLRKTLVVVLSIVSRQLATDVVRMDIAVSDPSANDASIQVTINPDATPAEIEERARWFSHDPAAQEMYRNLPAMVMEAIAPTAARGTLH
jgi:hypothetical protein